MRFLKSALIVLTCFSVILAAWCFLTVITRTEEGVSASAVSEHAKPEAPISIPLNAGYSKPFRTQQDKNSGDNKLNPVSFPERGQVCVDDLDDALILDRRIADMEDGKIQRLFLVNGGGSYPYHRIEEILQYDEEKGQYAVAYQSMTVADHFLVKLRPGESREQLEKFNERFNARIMLDMGFANKYMVQLPTLSLDGVPDAIVAYQREKGWIERVHADFIHAPTAIPNDTNWSSQWDKQRIDCPEAWGSETGSTEIIIAIIDTGVDIDHPDLAAHLWRNPGEAGALATNGVDDDGNGYVDDWIGYDFGKNDNNPDDNGDEDYDGTFSESGHGTHCAGIAGAIGNNSTHIAGVCWNVTIMALKPFEYMSTYGDMRVISSKANEAMRYAAHKGAKVTSNSYGGLGGDGSEFYDGVNYQNERGVLFVAAAGNDYGNDNDTSPHQPSNVNLPNVVSVASSDSSEDLSGFSNYGATTVDIVAPGSSIRSTFSGGSTATYSGTSMAGPQVAGAVALLYSANPELPYLDCKQALLDGVDKFAAYSGKCVSGGRLNVSSSLDLLGPIKKFPYTESFEGSCGRWSCDTGTTDWIRHSGETPLTGTGPSGAADGSFYLYVDGANMFDIAKLTAPFDFSDLLAPEITWSYHMHGNVFGDLFLEASTNGMNWDVLWSLSSDPGDQWFRTNVNLSAFAGYTNVQVRFRYDLSGFGFNPDAAIDDILIEEGEIASDGDLDDDGLPDKWETRYFGGPTNANPNATASNGVNTVRETYIAGLDPTSPTNRLLLSVLCPPSSDPILSWNAVTARVYSVWFTTNLLNTFQPLETNILFPQSSYTDEVDEAGRFYKIDVRMAE